jgi:hypothetical protein
MDTTMGERIVERLQNPDVVGESAYRAVHELVQDAVQSAHIAEEDDTGIRRLVLAELDNLVEWAKEVKKLVEYLPGPIPHNDHALSSDPRYYRFLLVDHADRVRDAYMSEEGARRDAVDGDTVQPRGEGVPVECRRCGWTGTSYEPRKDCEVCPDGGLVHTIRTQGA